MVKDKKCANPACSCAADKGSDYCSAHCEGTADKTEVVCTCGHPGCRGDATNVKTAPEKGIKVFAGPETLIPFCGFRCLSGLVIRPGFPQSRLQIELTARRQSNQTGD